MSRRVPVKGITYIMVVCLDVSDRSVVRLEQSDIHHHSSLQLAPILMPGADLIQYPQGEEGALLCSTNSCPALSHVPYFLILRHVLDPITCSLFFDPKTCS